jgi:hypothetical protein
METQYASGLGIAIWLALISVPLYMAIAPASVHAMLSSLGLRVSPVRPSAIRAAGLAMLILFVLGVWINSTRF